MVPVLDPDCGMPEALSRYRETVSILKRGYATERYRIEQISASFLGQLRARQVSSVDIARYRDLRLATINLKTGQPLSPATVRLEMSLLSNFFDVGRIEWGICDANPVANVRKPKPAPGRDRRLTAREERLILRYCHGHANRELYSIVVLGLETAMRQGEILRLTWENIHLKSRVAHLPETKNGTKRDVPLSIRAREALTRLGTKTSGRVFSYTSAGLKSTWRFMLTKLGIADLHFHDLRHEAVSRLFELGGLDMMEVAAISGHKSLSMLKRYTHLKAGKLARKLEAPKNRNRRAVLDYLIPYPAAVESSSEGIRIRVLDFDNLVVGPAATADDAIRITQDALLRQLLSMMRASARIPPPDQYLESVPEESLVMIDPMATEDVATLFS